MGLVGITPHWPSLSGTCGHCRRLASEQSVPSKKDYQTTLTHGLRAWTNGNGLPSIPANLISELVQTLWQQHAQQVTCHIAKSSINGLQKAFEGAIFHCEDKQASSLRIFCPRRLYIQAIQDTSIFETIDQEPQAIVSSLVSTLQRDYGRSYPLAIGKGRQLPAGYILAKKAYQSGRPIISFVDSPFRPMLNILARMIFELIPVACPDHFALGDVYTLLTVLQTAPIDGDLILVNQDLAGFFTSIDQARFIGTWYMLLDFLRPHMNVGDNEVSSAYPGKSNNPGDLVKGRAFRRLNVTRKIVIKDVPSLLTTALDMQTFALGSRCVRQRRDNPIGSPFSPALCLMVVSISEQIWSMNFKEALINHNLFIRHIRYVDKPLIFGDNRLQQLHPYEVLLDEGFYGSPIALETEPDQQFLGFMLETAPLELIHCGPTNMSQVLSPFSASPPKVLLSGFRSRCPIVVKGAFPAHLVQQGLDQLTHLYTLAGFSEEELNSIPSQILHQHQQVISLQPACLVISTRS